MKIRNKIYRKSVFVVVYRFNSFSNKPEYLILKRKLHWRGWEFPKGGVDWRESLVSAVKRETREETGLKIIKINKYALEGKYIYGTSLPDRAGFMGQTFKLFSVLVIDGKVKLDKREHSMFTWLSYSQALKKLTWKNQKKCLKIVNKELENKKIKNFIS